MSSNSVQRSLLDGLELVFGATSPHESRVYARLAMGIELNGTAGVSNELRSSVPGSGTEAMSRGTGLSLTGTVSGPNCPYARTLPATYALTEAGPGDSLMAAGLVTDPCFWTPESPYLYDVEVELRRGGDVIERIRRPLGIRRLGADLQRLIFDGKPWVLRGVSREAMPATPLTDWHAAAAAMCVANPDDELCAEASRLGVLIVAVASGAASDLATELPRLARWPAVGIVAITTGASLPDDVSRSVPNVLLAADCGTEPLDAPPAWAQVMMTTVDAPAAAADRARVCLLPVIARRSTGPQPDVAAARRQCDRLQGDLAGSGRFAGYVV